MREIKFRAWEKSEERMYAVDGVFRGHVEVNESVNDDGDIDLYGDYVLMQYTGLKDRNGKEIYEGDIVKMEEGWQRWDDNNGPCVVIFEDGSFLPFGAGGEYTWDDGPDGHVEVIGNIFENPELLKG